MNNREANFEQNLARLLKAGCSPEEAVNPALRERLHARLTRMLLLRRQPAEFPKSALGIMTAMVLLPCLVWAACAWWGAVGMIGCVLNGPILVFGIVNLIDIPIASLVIILRRKYA